MERLEQKVHIYVDRGLKADFDRLCRDREMTTSQAIRLFMKSSLAHGDLIMPHLISVSTRGDGK
jgi:antitoxin component of RelBE/YafQ-DinJ toxin-antitoxin module